MKIWIISLFDPTLVDNTRPMRFLSLVNEATNQGHDVTYYSNTFRHATKKFRINGAQVVEHHKNSRTVFLDSRPYKGNTSIGRFYSHWLYARNLMRQVRNSINKPDAIVSALPPLIVNYMLVKWAKRNGVNLIVDIIDPWPDVFFNYLPRWSLGIFRIVFLPYSLMVKYILNNTTGVASISGQYIEWAERRVNKTLKNKAVFYPSVDFEDYQAKIKKHYNPERAKVQLRIIYAGNLGLSYDIPCILEAAKILDTQYHDQTHFIIAGVGFYEDLIRKYQDEVSNIEYLGRIGHDELMNQYANCDLGLAQYKAGATQSITYKFFDYLGCGIPILNSLLTEMAKLIDERGIGKNNNPENPQELARNISAYLNSDLLEEHKENAKVFTRDFGNSKVVYANYLAFILGMQPT